MSNILTKIQQIASNEGITIGAMERSIGASKGVLSRAISNGTDIQAKWLLAIVENYPRYSAEWLLTGEGSMLKSNTPKADGATPSPNEASPKAKKSEKTSSTEDTAAFLSYMREQATAHTQAIKEKDTIIMQQNQEITDLRCQVTRLEGENQHLTEELHRIKTEHTQQSPATSSPSTAPDTPRSQTA